MPTILKIAAAVGVTLAIVYRRSLMQMFGASGPQSGRPGPGATDTGPLGRYQEKIDEAGETLKQAKAGLDRCRTLINSLQRQVADGERDVARLDVRIKAALSEGHEDRAAEYVQQFQKAKAMLAENQKQLAVNQEIYNSFLKQVQVAQDRIVRAKRDAESLGSQLRTSQAEAELADVAQNTSAASDFAASEPDREEVLRRIDAEKAKVQTAQDLSAPDVEEIEDERVREAEAQALLDQYKASMQDSPAPPAQN